jgi:hypothetical protein
MPNGGPTPDCFHCKHYRGMPRSEGEPYCDHHQMNLAYPIRAFCSEYEESEPGWEEWADLELNYQQLKKDLMYLWLGDGHEIKFFHVPLAPIAEYKDWTQEKFLEELGNLADKYRNA